MDITLGYIILVTMFIFFAYGAWSTDRHLKAHEVAENEKRKLKVYRIAEKMALYRLEQSEATGVLYSK